MEDIEFILSHFDDQLQIFPRKMMTSISNGQFSVTSKEEIFQRCKDANYVDCRINAYPEYADYKGIMRQPPNFVFIDLDLSSFSSYRNPMKRLDWVLKNTLKKILFSSQQCAPYGPAHHYQQQAIYESKPIHPTVLWSGNGYHIYLPIQAVVLDEYEPFSRVKFPNLFSPYGKYHGYSISEVFLEFAEKHFTEGKSDPQHRPKHKTCLVRVPNTLNSKCFAKGLSQEESKVKIIQRWDGYRLPIQLLTKEFRRWISQEEINQKTSILKNNLTYKNQFNTSNVFKVIWIEKLLQTGIPDGRKETLRLILGPYLTKRKNHEEAVYILNEWLMKCNDVERLDINFNPKQRINASLKNSKGFLKIESLKVKHNWLYNVINRFLI